MAVLNADPGNLQLKLDAAQPGDTVELVTDEYSGEFTLRVPGVTVKSHDGGTPVFRGPAKPVSGQKPTWFAVRATATGATLDGLIFARDGDIYQARSYNDYGIVIEADDATVTGCQLSGMAKGIHIKGACLRPTITHNHIGPTFWSNLVLGTSYSTIRAALVAWNTLDGSVGEDGVQFMQDFDATNPLADVSNLGAILYGNVFDHHNENAIDLKGAGMVVIDGNIIRRVAGSNNGPIDGWNKNSLFSIGRGANTSSGLVLVRNNSITETCAGVRLVDPDWYIVHNHIENNNYRPETSTHQGYGIRQPGSSSKPRVINNFARDNRAGDYLLNGAQSRGNRTDAGPGEPLTWTREAGEGRELSLVDAGYFMDWFGRAELPPDVLFLGDERFTVAAVDYAANVVQLDRDATWVKDTPVCWRSPTPVAGIQDEWQPPPIEPPEIETVRLLLSAEMTPAEAAQLRSLLDGRQVNVSLE